MNQFYLSSKYQEKDQQLTTWLWKQTSDIIFITTALLACQHLFHLYSQLLVQSSQWSSFLRSSYWSSILKTSSSCLACAALLSMASSINAYSITARLQKSFVVVHDTRIWVKPSPDVVFECTCYVLLMAHLFESSWILCRGFNTLADSITG